MQAYRIASIQKPFAPFPETKVSVLATTKSPRFLGGSLALDCLTNGRKQKVSEMFLTLDSPHPMRFITSTTLSMSRWAYTASVTRALE